MATLLYDFLTSFNLFILLLCIIGLYWSINLVINYYAPTSSSFVNMYFLYYIFFTTTLLVAVGCSNYIEMDDFQDALNELTKNDISKPLIDRSGSVEMVSPKEKREIVNPIQQVTSEGNPIVKASHVIPDTLLPNPSASL